MTHDNKNLCNTHIIGNQCLEEFLILTAEYCQPLHQSGLSLAGSSNLIDEYVIGRLKPAWHTLLMMESGRLILDTDGERHDLQRDSVAVLPAGTSYRYSLKSESARVQWFHLKRRRRYSRLEKEGIISRRSRFSDQIRFCLNELLKPALHEKITSSLSATLMEYLRLELGTDGSSIPDFQEEKLAGLWKEIERRPVMIWNIDRMARYMNVSSGHLHRLTKDIYDCSPMARVTQIRMNHAGCLLQFTPLRIYEIASAVGYSDEFAFSTAFRRFYSIPPRDFRKRKA